MIGMPRKGRPPHPVFKDKPVAIRTHRMTVAALKRAVANVVESGKIQFLKDDPTQEAIVNASWLLMESLGTEWLLEHLEPMLRKLEGLAPDESGSVPAGEEPESRSHMIFLGDRPGINDVHGDRHQPPTKTKRSPKRRT